jgi:MFS family permease
MDHTDRNILTVLFAGVLMGALDIAIVGPALPAIQIDFALDERILSWTVTIYVLFNLIGTPLIAKLSDLMGHRRSYILSVTLFAVGSLMVVLSRNFVLLLVGRAVQGFGSGGVFPIASAMIGEVVVRDKRGQALGFLGAVYGLAFLIGPILGALFLLVSWRLLFVVNLPISLVIIVTSWRVLPATRSQDRSTFDWAGMAVLTGLLVSVTCLSVQLDTRHITRSLLSREVYPFLIGAALLLPVFWRIETAARNAIVPMYLFATRQTVLAGLFSAAAGLFQGTLVFVPAFLVSAYEVTTARASMMLVPVVLVLCIGAPIAGRLLDQLGSKVVIMGGSCLVTVGMLLLGLFGSNLVGFYGSAVAIGLGLASLIGAPLRYIMLNETPEPDRTTAQGTISLISRTGLLLSSVLVGAIVDSAGGGAEGYKAAYLFAAGVAALLIALSLGFKSRTEEMSTSTAIS